MEGNDMVESSASTCTRGCNFIRSTRFKLYCGYALSTWGDRMWMFCLSLALYTIEDDLRLPALSGLVNGLSILFFGSTVGRWIDTTPRLRAARTSLVLNNVCVTLSAVQLIVVLYWKDSLDSASANALIAGAILFCSLSALAGMASKICLTKDWTVVICNGNKEKLSAINASMLRVDLTAMIISPLLAGQLMASFSIAIGCLFIACWNVSSLAIEYSLLYAIYKCVPQLAIKNKVHRKNEKENGTEMAEVEVLNPENLLKAEENGCVNGSTSTIDDRKGGVYARIRVALHGWKLYFAQPVMPAAMALAMLYLTVMGLDGITTGYAYSQGLKENVLAIVRGAGAAVGISGSLLFPRMRSNLGLQRTGLFGLSSQILCNTLAVVSVWLPGSPFNPSAYFGAGSDWFGTGINSTVPMSTVNSTVFPTNITLMFDNSTMTSSPSVTSYHNSYCSISAFLAGLVLARFGLWVSDLTITQIMQESIPEKHRGAVFGVQFAIQNILSLSKDLLVIALPHPMTFGFLIIISWVSVFSGFLSYAIYSRRVRGHILPFHNQFGLCVGGTLLSTD